MNGLRSRIALQVDGGLKTGRDVIIGALLGADEFGFATAPLIAAGCIMMRKCHLNTCPRSALPPRIRCCAKRFKGTPEHVIKYFFFVAEEVREILASLGVSSSTRSSALPNCWKGRDARPLEGQGSTSRRSSTRSSAEGSDLLDRKAEEPSVIDILDRKLIEKAMPALESKQPVVFDVDIKKRRPFGCAMLSGEVAKRYGHKGLKDDTIHVTLNGTAGQSFGAFLARGITFDLVGDGTTTMSARVSRVAHHRASAENARIVAENSIIVGNTVLYGAISGECYFRGVAGERFAVRNSGAIAVVEGVGDHGCEYMTGGVVVVLGEMTGRNFAAGMSGGVWLTCSTRAAISQALQHGHGRTRAGSGRGRHAGEAAPSRRRLMHKGLVDVSGDMNRHDEERLYQLISNHLHYTGSNRAKRSSTAGPSIVRSSARSCRSNTAVRLRRWNACAWACRGMIATSTSRMDRGCRRHGSAVQLKDQIAGLFKIGQMVTGYGNRPAVAKYQRPPTHPQFPRFTIPHMSDAEVTKQAAAAWIVAFPLIAMVRPAVRCITRSRIGTTRL